jgi:hypothetical protein
MNLTKAVQRKLGRLVDVADQTVAEVIRARGGKATNVREVGPWANKSLGETAQAALAGDESAEKAIKIAKQARRLGQKYGGDAS